MEVDTISEETFKEIESPHAQVKSRPESRSYTTESVKVIGTVTMTVEYGQETGELQSLVMDGSGPNLLGGD